MNLKEYLDENDKMYNKVAKKIGCSTVYFNELVNGKKYPSIKLARKLEEYSQGAIKWYDLVKPENKLQVTCFEGKEFK